MAALLASTELRRHPFLPSNYCRPKSAPIIGLHVRLFPCFRRWLSWPGVTRPDSFRGHGRSSPRTCSALPCSALVALIVLSVSLSASIVPGKTPWCKITLVRANDDAMFDTRPMKIICTAVLFQITRAIFFFFLKFRKLNTWLDLELFPVNLKIL